MWTFLASGTLYLLGVAAVLVYKPRTMFTPDGNWKEFGIGKREDRYTAFPFWLFCITWAIVSYVLVELVVMLKESGEEIESNLPTIENAFNNGNRNMKKGNTKNKKQNYSDLDTSEQIGNTIELPKGYYMLNEKATKLSGMPKYIYLGAEAE